MIGFIFLGMLVGVAMASLSKTFTFKDVFGSVLLATFGALEGKLIASFLSYQGIITSRYTSTLIIISGAIFLILLKKIFFPAEKPRQLDLFK